MKHHTKEAIEAKLKEVWRDSADDWRDLAVAVFDNEPEMVYARITSMYAPPGVTLAKLNECAAFFECTNVDVNDTVREGGCETCDYGSEYGFYLRAWP